MFQSQTHNTERNQSGANLSLPGQETAEDLKKETKVNTELASMQQLIKSLDPQKAELLVGRLAEALPTVELEKLNELIRIANSAKDTGAGSSIEGETVKARLTGESSQLRSLNSESGRLSALMELIQTRGDGEELIAKIVANELKVHEGLQTIEGRAASEKLREETKESQASSFAKIWDQVYTEALSDAFLPLPGTEA